MFDFDDRPSPAAAAEEARAAYVEELKREEWSRNGPPISGFAIAALVIGVGGWVGLLMGAIISLIGMVCALVFAVAALSQIRQRERRGLGLAIAAIVVIVAWAVAISVAVSLVN